MHMVVTIVKKMSDAYKEAITNETLAIMNGIKNDTLLPNEFISDTIKNVFTWA